MLDEQLEAGTLAQKRKGQLLMILGAVAVVLLLAVIHTINTLSTVNEPPVDKAPTLSGAQLEQARAQFMADLQRFEQNVEPSLQNPALMAFDTQTVSGLLKVKEEALKAFAASDYLMAVRKLTEVTAEAGPVVARWNEAFDQAFAAANRHFEQGDMHRAGIHIDQALAVKPTVADALALKTRLDVWPEVERLLGAAKVAKIEHKLQGEMNLLQQVLILDPERQSLTGRIDTIKTTLKDNRFTAKIQSGMQFISQGDVRAATTALNEASAIYPGRSELKLLSQKIGQTKQDWAMQRAVDEVELLIVEDNWEQVQVKTSSLSKKLKNNARLLEAGELAKKLLALERRIEKYLGKPHRLTDSNIAAQVTRWLKDSKSLSQNSFRIDEKRLQLKAQMETLSVPVEVTVRSDGRTQIKVVGVGHVGKVKSYQVKLKPGHYVFEGKRKGYKSTLIPFDVVPAMINQQVTVICDEQIRRTYPKG